MTDLILHIGHPKCGSSTIQDFIGENWKILRENGIAIVTSQAELYTSASQNPSAVPYAKRLKEATLSPNDFLKDIKKLEQSCQRAGATRMLISAENLADADLAVHFKELPTIFDKITVIYYIRRPDEWLLSSWKQWKMKIGLSLERVIKAHLKQPRTKYKDVLEAWQESLPAADFIVRSLKREHLVEGDLLADFADAIKVPMTTMNRVENSNFSINDTLAHGLSKTPFLFEGTHDNELTSFLKEHLGSTISKNPYDAMDIADRRRILRVHQAETKWLEDNFFKNGELRDWTTLKPEKRHKPLSDTDAILQMQAINMQLLMKLFKK